MVLCKDVYLFNVHTASVSMSMELAIQIKRCTVLFCNEKSILHLLDTDYINHFNFQNENKDKLFVFYITMEISF